MKIGSYNSYTPRKWKKLGDALLVIGTTITTYAIFNDDKTFALISLICTLVGKLIPNFLEDEDIIMVRKENTTVESNSISDTDGCICGSEECLCKKD